MHSSSDKTKIKAQRLYAAAYELVGKTASLQRASLREADRLMDGHEYEKAIGWLEEFVRIEGAKLKLMTPHNPTSLLAMQPVTIAKFGDLSGQQTIFSITGDE
jgi:hypothetical protein